jgi:hypothetical protein
MIFVDYYFHLNQIPINVKNIFQKTFYAEAKRASIFVLLRFLTNQMEALVDLRVYALDI